MSVQGTGGISTPGSFKKHVVVVLRANGLVLGLAVLWEQLKLMTLEVFCSINDSVIPGEQALIA